MGKNRKFYAIMANRKMLWLASVVVISIGLIFNIILGVRVDIQFTGGTMLRYSYPESGMTTEENVSASTEPMVSSDSDVQHIEPKPAEAPVIISDSDLSEGVVSSSDNAQEAPSGGSGAGVVSGSTVTGSDATVTPGDVSGIVIQPDYSTNVDPKVAGRILTEALGEEVSIQISTNADSPTGGENKRLTVTLSEGQEMGLDADAVIRQIMEEQYPNVMLTLRESNSVDPTVGSAFMYKCTVAVILSVLAMLLYMGLRYRSIGGWSAGVSALIAVAHDCLAAYFAFVVFGFTIDDHFIAVILAIIGLSLNSTIVIFDRIRENRRLLGEDVTVAEAADRSVNETMGRTVCTDLCVFIAMAVLAVVSAVYGLDAMLSFAVPMMVGIIAGCYSSLCISSTIWATWQEQMAARRAVREEQL